MEKGRYSSTGAIVGKPVAHAASASPLDWSNPRLHEKEWNITVGKVHC